MAVVIELDKPRQLKFGVTAAREYKRQTGNSLIEVLTRIMKEASEGKTHAILDLDTLAALLWATLRHGDRNITIDKAADLLDAYLDRDGTTLEGLIEAIVAAFTESVERWGYGKEKDAPAEAGKAPAANPAS